MLLNRKENEPNENRLLTKKIEEIRKFDEKKKYEVAERDAIREMNDDSHMRVAELERLREQEAHNQRLENDARVAKIKLKKLQFGVVAGVCLLGYGSYNYLQKQAVVIKDSGIDLTQPQETVDMEKLTAEVKLAVITCENAEITAYGKLDQSALDRVYSGEALKFTTEQLEQLRANKQIWDIRPVSRTYQSVSIDPNTMTATVKYTPHYDEEEIYSVDTNQIVRTIPAHDVPCTINVISV
jgi:hypothetical protein